MSQENNEFLESHTVAVAAGYLKKATIVDDEMFGIQHDGSVEILTFNRFSKEETHYSLLIDELDVFKLVALAMEYVDDPNYNVVVEFRIDQPVARIDDIKQIVLKGRKAVTITGALGDLYSISVAAIGSSQFENVYEADENMYKKLSGNGAP